MDLRAAEPALEDDLARCVHCGLCLEHCPTYLATGMETESPRGRVHLIGAVVRGDIPATDTYARHVALCLVCRHCEAVCPSGVPFGRIMERARFDLARERRYGLAARALRWFVLEQILPCNDRLRAAARLLWLCQRSLPRALVRGSGVLGRIAPRLAEAEALLPELSASFFPPGPRVVRPVGSRRLRVAFFTGCVMPLLYPQVHEATLRVLARNGCEVVVPASDGRRGLSQGCCGALNLHAGERARAAQMARRNIEAFLSSGVEAVVVNAAGCGAALKEYGQLLAGDPTWADPARRFSALVRDAHELLAELPLEPPAGELPLRVTLQESCHLAHAQRLKDPPRQVLATIPGLRLVDMAHPDLCCGSAGVYNVLQPRMARAVLDARLAEIAATRAEVVATCNPGCMLQLEFGARLTGLGVRVAHVLELLDLAYQAERASP